MKLISTKMQFMLLALIFSAAGVSAHADDSVDRIRAWSQVSQFQQQSRHYMLSYAKWAHIPGNESKTQKEFQQANKMKQPDAGNALKAALKVAQINATDDLGYLAIEFLWRNARQPEQREPYLLPALALLEKHYLTDPRIETSLLSLARSGSRGGGNGDAMLAVVRKVIERNKPSSSLRVQAAYFYANEHLNQLNTLAVPEEKRRKLRKELINYARLVIQEGENETLFRQPAKPQGARLLNAVENLSIGSVLPNVKSNLVGGGEDELKNHRGKVVLLDFWATWCVPCVANLPKVVKLKEEMKGQPFEVIAVSVDDSDEEVIEFMEDQMELPFVNWHLGAMGTSGVYRDWNINGVPTYFLIDEKGVIQARGSFNGIPERARELVSELTGK